MKINIFKKCNFLIIIFLSQIATLLVFRVDDIIKTFHFAVCFQTTTFEMKRCLFSAYYFPVFFFQTATFEILRYLFSAYHFPVLVQIATFEILRYLCDVIKHFPYIFKNKFIFVTESIFYKFIILSISTTKCTNTTACYSF